MPKIYAYKTDEHGNIIAQYQGPNPPNDFDHRYKEPLASGVKIINWQIVEPGSPAVESANP